MEQPRNYALVDDGEVTNIIWLLPSNSNDFPSAVCADGVPVSIGDAYIDGVFWHNGVPLGSHT